MLTAAHLRYLTYASGISRRFVDFSVDAFHASRDANDSLWVKHFAKTGFDERPSEFDEIAAEILLSRTVDAFQCYIADIAAWALWRKPTVAGLLEEAKKLASDSFIDLDDAVKQVARLEAERRSYNGFRAMIKFIEDAFSTTVPLDTTKTAYLKRLIATRNMIAHNHSKKNRRYCKDVGEPEQNVGQSVRPTLTDAHDAMTELRSVVALIDNHLATELLQIS